MIIKILTYNIWGMPWGTKQIHQLLMWVFCESGADIICLQEVFSKNHRRILQEKSAAAHWQCFFPEDPCFAGKCLNAFTSGSGLCILVSPRLTVLHEIPFVAYSSVDSYLERLVKKGFFGVRLQKDGVEFTVINTHMIADMTECSPLRIAHGHTRRLQEKQLVLSVKPLKGPTLVVGDLNQEEHHYLHRLYEKDDWTFTATAEQLDHVTCLPCDAHNFQVEYVTFFQDISFSDHIPLRVDLHITSNPKKD